MCLCEKCSKLCGALLLVFALLFLLRDLNIWDFWNIQFWTVGFALLGFACFGKCCCPECRALAKKK